ncbi:Protocadherin-23 [Frankliniella fusca]|uniref:Protocadherin-23 n=1 Tax=Frankliniella fusca TaxID=407009 RepID=A0AAE1HY84_9NEOP|nr:Protocadherin-23 [Frankliniella fusca]
MELLKEYGSDSVCSFDMSGDTLLGADTSLERELDAMDSPGCEATQSVVSKPALSFEVLDREGDDMPSLEIEPIEPECPVIGFEVESPDLPDVPSVKKSDIWSRLGAKVEEAGPCERKACRPQKVLTPVAKPATAILPGNMPAIRPMGNVPSPVPRNPQPKNPPGYEESFQEMLTKRKYDDDDERKKEYEERQQKKLDEKMERRKRKKKE